MAKWTKLQLLKDDGDNYVIIVNDPGRTSSMYVHSDGTLHSRTDRREDTIPHDRATYKTAKAAASAFEKAILNGSI